MGCRCSSSCLSCHWYQCSSCRWRIQGCCWIQRRPCWTRPRGSRACPRSCRPETGELRRREPVHRNWCRCRHPPVHAPVVYYGKRSAEPQLVYAGVPAYHHALTYAVPTVAVKPLTLNTEVVATGQSVPVAVGGYKAEAGDNGDLKGAVHEVPGLVPAPALNKQENANGGALTVGTGAFVKYSLSKRSADASPAVLASSVSFVNPAPTVYHAPVYHAPYTYSVAHAPLLWG